jgi:hypothetical protein
LIFSPKPGEGSTAGHPNARANRDGRREETQDEAKRFRAKSRSKNSRRHVRTGRWQSRARPAQAIPCLRHVTT